MLALPAAAGASLLFSTNIILALDRYLLGGQEGTRHRFTQPKRLYLQHMLAIHIRLGGMVES